MHDCVDILILAWEWLFTFFFKVLTKQYKLSSKNGLMGLLWMEPTNLHFSELWTNLPRICKMSASEKFTISQAFDVNGTPNGWTSNIASCKGSKRQLWSCFQMFFSASKSLSNYGVRDLYLPEWCYEKVTSSLSQIILTASLSAQHLICCCWVLCKGRASLPTEFIICCTQTKEWRAQSSGHSAACSLFS